MLRPLRPSILTNIEEPRVSRCWQNRTDFRRKTVGGSGWWSDICGALELLRLSRRYDAVVISSNRSGNLFLVLAALLPIRFPPVIVAPCIWDTPRRGIRRWLKRLQFRLMSRRISRLVVWCREEIADYSAELSIPEEAFVHIPHHHTLEGYRYDVSEEDYIFAGGDGHRDYPTLLDAVSGLGCRTIIAALGSNWHRGAVVPAEVTAGPTNKEEFRKLMAGARLVVLPMEGGHVHVGGEQTYLNAMAMGKPVIVTDNKGAPDYIEHGVNGLIVPPGDSVALRRAIKSVIDDRRFAATLARNARKTYDTHSTPLCMQKILRLVESVVGQ